MSSVRLKNSSINKEYIFTKFELIVNDEYPCSYITNSLPNETGMKYLEMKILGIWEDLHLILKACIEVIENFVSDRQYKRTVKDKQIESIDIINASDTDIEFHIKLNVSYENRSTVNIATLVSTNGIEHKNDIFNRFLIETLIHLKAWRENVKDTKEKGNLYFNSYFANN